MLPNIPHYHTTTNLLVVVRSDKSFGLPESPILETVRLGYTFANTTLWLYDVV